jgi:hypothetical protein
MLFEVSTYNDLIMQERPLIVTFLNAARIISAFVISIGVVFFGIETIDFFHLNNSTFSIVAFCIGPALFSICFLLSLAQDWNDEINQKNDDWLGTREDFKISWKFIETRFYRTLHGTGIALIAQLILYVVIRLIWGGLVWLKTGASVESSSCQLLELFCYNDTGWVGIDKLLNWLGSSDALNSLSGVMLLGVFFMKFSENKLE